KALIDQLATAVNAPRDRKGDVRDNALPQFFNTWCKSAWVDILNALPDEAAAPANADAAEEVHSLVAAALLSMQTLAAPRDSGSGLPERRSLINWCSLFAKSGAWKGIRSFQIWCRMDELAGGEVVLKVAIRHGLFRQVNGDRRLIDLGPKTFTRQARLY